MITWEEVEKAEQELILAKSVVVNGKPAYKEKAKVLAELRRAWREQEEVAGNRKSHIHIRVENTDIDIRVEK